MNNRTTLVALLAISGAIATSQLVAASTESSVAGAVREKLANLPYYGVFDALRFEEDGNGTVELRGFVYDESLKREAEAAVSKVSGVTKVVNRIEKLWLGASDHGLRAQAYVAIYRDSVLSRYGSEFDQVQADGWGTASSPRSRRQDPIGNPYPDLPGLNPYGPHAIHILVSRGEVTLVGEVDTKGDKIIAGLNIRKLGPVREVINDLTVKGEDPDSDLVLPRPEGRGGTVIRFSSKR